MQKLEGKRRQGRSGPSIDTLGPHPSAAASSISATQDKASTDVMDTEGAANYLSVSRQLLELMRVSGGGPRYAKLGRLVRYRRASLDAWLIARERSHTSEGAQA